MSDSASAGAIQKAKDQQRAEIVDLLVELREEFTDRNQWSVKRATWTMAILAAEGKLDKGRKPNRQGEMVEEESDSSGDRAGSGDAGGV